MEEEDRWFTIEEVDQSTYAISEYRHWEQTHAYLVIGSDKAALIDTGLGVANISSAVARMTKLPIQVITTHAHWDHIGGHRYYDEISVHQADAKWLSDGFPIPLPVVISNLLKEPCTFPQDFDSQNYSIYQGTPSHVLQDNDIIELGNRQLQVIHTPGHSPGHICLFEKETGYLFSGDLIYKGTLDAFYPSTDPRDFMNSVLKVNSLAVKRVLPAHFSLDVPVSMIAQVSCAFTEIERQDKLKQGSGLFNFNSFSIHL